MAQLLYLDYNCFQRGFDDQNQNRIRMETCACEEIFRAAENRDIRLVWSFMHDDETRICPFSDRQLEVRRLSDICSVKVGPNEVIRKSAVAMQNKFKLSSKDAIHLAVAQHSGAELFLTCDDGILNKADKIDINISIMNPVEYVLRKR